MRQTIDARWITTRRWRGMLALVVLVGSSSVYSSPSGEEITAGAGTIERAGAATTIDQSSNKLAINWQTFDIGAGESVRFNQPSSQSIALNRILGQDPTTILGSLSANGQVFLLNPNGVLFGAGSQVDVGGVFASTQSISDADFLAGRYTFSGSGAGGSVLNQGTIRAADGGYVALGGTNVVNDGVIRAYKGTVALGAGDQITLNIDGDRLVGFNVDKSAVAALVANKQLIQADGGSVLLSAQAKDALLATVLNNDGIIEARSVENVGGVIRLEGGASGVVAVSGTLDATGVNAGERGGDVTVTGDKVALLDGATIDASGRAGGGTVLVGGDTHGANADVQNAERTFVASSATMRADALDSGDGGRVVVWADGDTRFQGSISARGGAAGGDGGFVEVSGKEQLGFGGSVETSAPNGDVGTLLLDPNDLYISSAAVGGALQDSTNPFQSIDGVNDYYVLASTLTGLPANTAVQLQANRNIVVQTNLAMPTTAAGSITFNAANAIQMGGFDLSTANGSVSMTAGAGGISNLGTLTLGTGTLTLNSSGAITQNAGDAIAGATSLVKQGAGTLTLSNANTYTGATTISAGTVAVTANNGLGTGAGGTTVASGATLDLQNVTYSTTEGLTLNGGTLATSTGTSSFAGAITLGANSIVSVGGAQLTTSGIIGGATLGIDKQGGGVLLLSGNNTYTGTTSISAGTLRLGAASRIADTSAVLVGGGATFDLNNFAETVGSLAGAGNVTLGSATLTAGGDNTTTSFSGTISGTGGLTKAGTGTSTLSGANTFIGATTINGGTLRASGGVAIADTSQVTLANTAGVSLDVANNETIGNLSGGGATGGNVTLNGNTLTVNEAGSTTFSGVASGTGGITKLGAGTLTLSGANTYTGTTTVTAGSLALGAANALANGSSLVVNGGTFAMGTRSDTLAGVQLRSGSITSSSGVLTSTTPYDLQSGTVSAILAGTVALNKSTGGTVALSGVNTYTGATNVNAGILQLGAANRVPNTSALTVASGATFDLNNFAETIGSVAGAGNITLGSATLTTGGDGTSTTFSGSISGTGGVTKTGAGTTTLSGTNTYTGATTINAGVLRASGGNAIADTSAVTLANTAGAALDLTGNETIGNLSGGGAAGGNVTLNANTLTVNEAGATTYSGTMSGAGGITKLGAGTLTVSGTNSYTGTTTVTAGTLALGASNVLANGSSIVVNGGTLSMTTRSDTVAGVQLQSGAITGTTGVLTSTSNFDLQSGTASAILAGTVALNKSTGGTVVLSGANTYTGSTNINGGTLQLGAAARIPDTSAVTVASGATFDLNGFTETVGSIAGAGNITLGAGILTAGGDGTSTTFAGSMSGSGGLTKAGAGILTLSGNNTYGGATTINLGTLRASGGNAIGDASAVTLANSAGTSLDLTNDETIGNLAGGGAAGGSVALNVNTLTVNEAGTTTFAGVASGSGGIAKNGAGTLTLSGANTYTGTTTVNAGGLTLSGGNAIADTALVNLLGGGLTVATAETIGNLSGAAGTTVTLTAGLTFGDATNATVASTISGAGALTKRGSGAVTLSGANTYTGATAVNVGTLVAANATALGTTAAGTTVASGATVSIANVAVGAEAVTLNGGGASSAGALTGTGNASLGGAVTLGSATTIGAVNNGDVLTLGGAVNGAQALTEGGLGTLTFGGAVGGATALASFASAATNATVIGGSFRTTGTQSYNGALTTTAPTTLTTTNSAIGASGAVNSTAGALTFATGTGAVTMTNAANDFGTVAITNAGAVNLVDSNALAFATSNFATLRAQTLAGDVTVNGVLTATGGGDSLVLASGGNFINNAGAAALNPGAGRRLVWSTNPALDVRGGLAYSFKQYGATYGTTTVAGAGNGFLYAVSPTLSPSLTGTVGKTYDGNTTANLLAGNFTFTGAIDGDTVTLSTPTTGAFADRNVGVNKSVSASGLSIASATNGAATVYGYQLGSTTASGNVGTIAAAPLTITAVTNTKTYDGNVSAAATPTVTGLVGGDTATGLTEAYANKNAGAGKALNVTGYTINDGNGGNNYSVSAVANATGVVNQAALVGSITASNKVYDATTAATIASRTLSGVVAGDSVTYTGGSATFSDKNAAAAKTVTATGLSLAGADAGNYTANSIATTTADITPLAITGSVTGANKAYDATTTAAITNRTVTGVLSGDSVAYSGGSATFADKNVGNAKVVTATGLGLTGTDAGNYTVNSIATTNADITPLAITGSVAAANKVYDATTGATIVNRVLAGVLGSDSVSYIGGTATFADKNVANGKTVTATGLGLAGADAGNYTVNSTAVTAADITPLAITGSVTAANKVYDATTAGTITNRTLAGVIGGDTVSYVGGTADFSNKNAALGKTVTATGLGLAGADAGNYTVNSTATTTADITPLAITGSVTAADKVYDATGGATIANRSLTGVLGGDTVNYVGGTANFSDKNVANGKTVTATGLALTGADAGNYTVNGTAMTTADITPLAISGSVTAANKVYDSTTNATITNRTLTGVLAGDNVTYTGGSATFVDKNAGTAKAVTATGLALAGADAGNYTVNSTAATTADITPATLTYVADPAVVERGEPFPTFTGAVAGFVGGDTVANATTGTPAFDTDAPNSNQLGVFAIDGSGLVANHGNYLFVQAPTNANALQITPQTGPDVPSGTLLDANGAVTTALQTEAVCTDERGGSARTCRGPIAVPVQHVARVAERVTPVAGTSFGREGAGIRLPAGASDRVAVTK